MSFILFLIRSFAPKKTKITLGVILDHFLDDCMALQWASSVVYDLEMLSATTFSTYVIMISRCLALTCLFMEPIQMKCCKQWSHFSLKFSSQSRKEGQHWENIWNMSIVALDHNWEDPHVHNKKSPWDRYSTITSPNFGLFV